MGIKKIEEDLELAKKDLTAEQYKLLIQEINDFLSMRHLLLIVENGTLSRWLKRIAQK